MLTAARAVSAWHQFAPLIARPGVRSRFTSTLGRDKKLASKASFSVIFVLFVLFVCFVVHRWLRPLVCHGNMPRVATLTFGL